MYEKSRTKYLFVVPGIVWVFVFTIFPLLYSLRLAFSRSRLGQPVTWAGLKNFQRAFSDYRFWDTLEVTLLFVFASVFLTVLLGLLLALLFNRPIRGQRVFRSLFTVPLFTAPVALGYLGLTIFHEEVGAVNTVLRAMGMTNLPRWFSDVWLARFAVILVDVWQWTPFCFLVILAALQGLPEEIYEAAYLDTSSSWDIFRSITLPLIAPVLLTVIILRFVEAFKILDIPFSLTNGGPGAATQTLSFYIYLTGLRNFNQGYASALAYILLIMVLIVSFFFFKRLRQNYQL
ncbi:MAG: sugar ABC transporter permease [Chloroflexi bacterium]|nr:MAG: sugar ABC transporter permease [Chloroflexota bacterium]